MSDALLQLFSRVGAGALARAALAILICAGVAVTSRHGAAGVLPAVATAYSILGSAYLGRGLRAELRKQGSEAAEFYAVALTYWFIGYASLVATRLISPLA